MPLSDNLFGASWTCRKALRELYHGRPLACVVLALIGHSPEKLCGYVNLHWHSFEGIFVVLGFTAHRRLCLQFIDVCQWTPFLVVEGGYRALLVWFGLAERFAHAPGYLLAVCIILAKFFS